MTKKTTLKSKVIQFVRENGPQRFTDIQRFIYDSKYGKGEYDKGYRMERTYDYDKEDYVMRRSNTNRGYFCCAFYGPRAYFKKGNKKLSIFDQERETLEELILRNGKPTNKSDRFSVERVDTKHMKVTLDGGNAFFFSNRQWDLVKKHILNSHYGSMDQARVRYEERQTTPIFKAQPGDTIFYIDDNKVCSANLIEITFRWTEGQKKVTKYTTVHGTYTADRIFKTKDELIKSL